MKSVDYKEGEKITLICLLGNLILSVLKGLAGFFGNSQAMIADAFHSASDVIATFVVYMGIKIAKKPVDESHPYGHGKIEPLAAAFVGVTLIFAAFSIVKEIVNSIITHSFVTPSYIALIAAFVSIVVKEIMFRYTYSAGEKINSDSIMANAWDHRSDAYSSVGTFIGIAGSMLGRYFGISFLAYLDPLAGALVACLIFKIAFEILVDSIKSLMDASPGQEKINQIKNVLKDIRGIEDIPWIKARFMGPYLLIDMAIKVDANLTVETGHNIAATVRSCILENIDEAIEVLVHVTPNSTRLSSEKIAHL